MRAAVLLALALAGCSPEPKPADFAIEGVRAGPLAADDAISAQLSGGEKISGLGCNGLRAVVDPFDEPYSYYTSLRSDVGCRPRAGVQSADIGDETRVQVRRVTRTGQVDASANFLIPANEVRRLFSALDWRIAHWKGSNFADLDGTSIRFERVSDGKIWSMWSNAEPSQDRSSPASLLLTDLLRILRVYGPAGLAPDRPSWDMTPPDGP